MKMRFVLFLSGFCLLAVYGFARSGTIKGNKKIVTQQIPITDYDVVNLASSADIIYELSDRDPYLEVTVDENILPYLQIEVINSVLNVSVKSINESGRGRSYNIHPTKCKIKTNSRDLKTVNLASSGDFTINSDIRRDELTINIASSGDVEMKKSFIGELLNINIAGSGDVAIADVNVDRLEVNVGSSGDIKVKGTAQKASYAVAGSGDINAFGCNAQDVTASVAGSGDIKLTASGTLKATIKGSGDITYKGNPTVLESNIRGSGDLRRR